MANKRLGNKEVLMRRSAEAVEVAEGEKPRFKGDTLHTFKGKRNAPCFCGSGKKYKYCCEAKILLKNPFRELSLATRKKLEEYAKSQKNAK